MRKKYFLSSSACTCSVTCISETGVADMPNMYGDLLLTPEQERELLVNDGEAEEEGIKQGVKLWPKGQVVYELDSRLSKQIHNM